MTVQTAINLTLFAVSVLTYARTRGPMSWLCDVCLFAAAVILEVMAAGFFDHQHVLYDVTGRMMAARQSGLAQMLLGGALAFGRTGRGAFAIFAEAGAGSAAMRILMPAIAVLPIVLGRLRRFAEQFGWVANGESFVPVVLTVAQVVGFGLVVYVFARYMNRIDARYLIERKRREEIERYVAVCAWTRKVRWQGRWVSIEEFLQRRFGFEVTHGISDEALAEQLASLVPHGTLPGVDDEERSR